MKSEISYAPVVIPTLNRYYHFTECFESLCRCTGAEKTDVYIGLDYPPQKEYVEGWKKIDDYLKEKEKDHPFHSLVIIRQDHNCGVGKPNDNGDILQKKVSSLYDRYIWSEDDNVFSPNFLEYINKGLEKYNDDSTVFAIVGYAHPYHFKHGENNHYRHRTDMSAWGVGFWVKKRKDVDSFVAAGLFKKSFSLRHILKFQKYGWNRLFHYLHIVCHHGFTWITDGVITSYLIINDMDVIVPTVSKVKNIGWDGSGCSSKWADKAGESVARRHINQAIDEATRFEFKGDDSSFVEYNNKVAVAESDGRISFFEFVSMMIKSFFRIL